MLTRHIFTQTERVGEWPSAWAPGHPAKAEFTGACFGKGTLGDIVGLVLCYGRCSSVFLLGQVVDAVGLWVGDFAEWEPVDGRVVGCQEQEGES